MLVANLRALLFDFGGTLDCTAHWLDRFLAHYRACGIEIERAQLDPAFDLATASAYRATERLSKIGLRATIDFLLRIQMGHLSCLGPEQVGQRFQQIGPSGVAELRHRIGAAFAAESLREMKRSREVLIALKPRFRLGVVSNFYGNL